MAKEKTVLDTLTPQQEQIVKDTKKWWIDFILSGGDEVDMKELTKWGKWLYSVRGFAPPSKGVFVEDSPLKCQLLANKLAGNEEMQWYNFAHESLGQAAGWVAYVDTFVNLDMFKNEEFSNFAKFLKAGAFMSITFDEALIVCRRPMFTSLNDKFELHNTEGMAIKWRDGYGLYFLNGVQMTEEFVMTPAETLDPLHIATEKNAEVRRELVKKIGIDRFIAKYSGNILDTWSLNEDLEYRLVALKMENMRLVPTYLIMRNPSTGVFYAEGVPQDCKTVKEALAWRDEDPHYIQPDILT